MLDPPRVFVILYPFSTAVNRFSASLRGLVSEISFAKPTEQFYWEFGLPALAL